MDYKQDIEIHCKCGNKFLYTVKDQIFYEENNYVPPKRCYECREERKRKFNDRERDNKY